MALLPWSYDDDNKNDDQIDQVPTIKTVSSVQNRWNQPIQPTDQSTPTLQQQQPQVENYLVSDEKAQRDEAKRQADAAAAIEAQRQAQAAREAEAAQSQAEMKQASVDAIKADDGWKQYYDEEFKKEKNGLDFFSRLLDNGQASRRAEVTARNRFNSDLIAKAYDDNGTVIDQASADRANGLSVYTKLIADNNSKQSEALSNSIGATNANKDQSFLDRVKSTINAEKNMSLYDALVGVDDTQSTDINDLGRFAGGLIQGIGTMPVVGAKELAEMGVGRGTDSETGLERDLTTAERAGRGVSGLLNVVTPFFGGSGQLLESLTAKATAGTITATEKTLLKSLTSKILLPALEQAGIGATQSGAEYFGDGGTLVDENGQLDQKKLLAFLKQAGEGGAAGFAGGAILGGTAAGVRRLRNGRQELTPAEVNDLETRVTNANEAQLVDSPTTTQQPIDLAAIERGEIQPANLPAVADGVTRTPDAATPVNTRTPIESALNNPQLLDNVTPVDRTQPVVKQPEVVESPVDQVDVKQVKPQEEMPTNVSPVADGVPEPSKVMSETVGNMPVLKGEQVRALKEAKAGASQADEAAINQRLQEAENTTPSDSNLPDDMNTDVTGVDADGSALTRKEVAERLMPKLADNSDTKQRIASAVNMGKDVESPVRDILRDAKVNPKQADRVATQFDKLEQHLKDFNSLVDKNQKAYTDGGVDALDENVSRDRSRITRDMGVTMRRLQNEIRHLEGSKDFKTKVVNNLVDIIGTRNANVLTSAGLIERNITQELTANLKLFAKNPLKMLDSTFGNGSILKDTAKGELSHWKDAPRNPVEAVKYVVGNTYRTAMIPTTSLANTRRGAVREELTRWAYKELEGRELGVNETKKLAGAAGNELEALVNTFIGVDNGMTNRGMATDAMKSWKEYIRSGDSGAKAEFLKRVEEHTSLADQMIAGLGKDDATRLRGLKAVGNLIFPFVRTATNLMKTTVQQDLNPRAKSLLDEIRADQRSTGENAINLVKSKLVDYGILAGAAAMASSGAVSYNNGDEVDRPQGWSISLGDGKYIPVRATSLELPIALAGTAEEIAKDVAAGKPRDWKYYAGMVTGSLPYIDQINQSTGAVDSIINMSDEDGDKGYAIKSYGVNMAKSFVPFSNNSIQPYVAGKAGESINAKTVYDKNLLTWLKNAIQKNYDPDFYNSLSDSRDNAGRVRTVDNQGFISNKKINDANTAEFNDRVSDLTKFGRELGLSDGTQDAFNSFDTGKNNNFRSTQNAIAFLDVADGQKPDKAKGLEKNAKLTDLSQQIKNGYYGDTGSDLLTLDGQNLKSDASSPNKDGTKNSYLPLSIQSIKNAIAQTDLSDEDSTKLFDISNQKTDLYNQLKAKSISYDQYRNSVVDLEKGEVGILSNSENYKKLDKLMNKLNDTGFFDEGGLGSTKAGQTYLWNSFNSLLGSKGGTPAAQYPDSSSFKPFGGDGTPASNKPGDRGSQSVKFTPVKAREMATVAKAKFTPFDVKVKLGNAIKKDKTQNYSDKTI